jgi:hypothetical protein
MRASLLYFRDGTPRSGSNDNNIQLEGSLGVAVLKSVSSLRRSGRALGTILGHMREEVTGSSRKSHSKELHNSCSALHIIGRLR